jgi:hypothetical protein
MCSSPVRLRKKTSVPSWANCQSLPVHIADQFLKCLSVYCDGKCLWQTTPNSLMWKCNPSKNWSVQNDKIADCSFSRMCIANVALRIADSSWCREHQHRAEQKMKDVMIEYVIILWMIIHPNVYRTLSADRKQTATSFCIYWRVERRGRETRWTWRWPYVLVFHSVHVMKLHFCIPTIPNAISRLTRTLATISLKLISM